MPCDYRLYPENWTSEIVPAIIERAKNCCEDCCLPNKSIVYSVKFFIRDETGKIKPRMVWFRNEQDANREVRRGEIKKVTVILTVAHLNHDETNPNIKLEDLKALCQACHLRLDVNEKKRRAIVKQNKLKLEL